MLSLPKLALGTFLDSYMRDGIKAFDTLNLGKINRLRLVHIYVAVMIIKMSRFASLT